MFPATSSGRRQRRQREQISELGAQGRRRAPRGLDANARPPGFSTPPPVPASRLHTLQRLPSRAWLTSLDLGERPRARAPIAEKRGVADSRHLARRQRLRGAAPAATYDVVICSHFFHHFDGAQNLALARRFFAALKPGGRLLVHDFVPDDARYGARGGFDSSPSSCSPPPNAGTPTPDGGLPPVVEGAGFRDLGLHPVPMGGSSVIVARRPG